MTWGPSEYPPPELSSHKNDKSPATRGTCTAAPCFHILFPLPQYVQPPHSHLCGKRRGNLCSTYHPFFSIHHPAVCTDTSFPSWFFPPWTQYWGLLTLLLQQEIMVLSDWSCSLHELCEADLLCKCYHSSPLHLGLYFHCLPESQQTEHTQTYTHTLHVAGLLFTNRQQEATSLRLMMSQFSKAQKSYPGWIESCMYTPYLHYSWGTTKSRPTWSSRITIILIYSSQVHLKCSPGLNTLGYKISLSKFKKMEIIQSISSDYSRMKLAINSTNKTRKSINIWKLNNTFLNN